MNYYVVNYEISSKHFADLSWGNLVNEKGEDVLVWDAKQPLSPFELGTGHDIRNYKKLFFRYDRSLRRGIGACMEYTVSCNFMFSETLMDVLKAASVRIDPATIVVPVEIVNARFEKVWPVTYYLLWAGKDWEVTDHDWSRLTYTKHARTGEQIVNKIYRWVLDESTIPDCDYFYTTHRKWLASDRFKDAVAKSGLLGVGFTITDLWTDDNSEGLIMRIGSTPELRKETRERVRAEVQELKRKRDEARGTASH